MVGQVDCGFTVLSTPFKLSTSNIGVEICYANCLAIATGHCDGSPSVPIASKGINILGMPIGST